MTQYGVSILAIIGSGSGSYTTGITYVENNYHHFNISILIKAFVIWSGGGVFHVIWIQSVKYLHYKEALPLFIVSYPGAALTTNETRWYGYISMP